MSESKDITTVSCSGDAASKHPKVFFTIKKGEVAKCPYCGKKYEK